VITRGPDSREEAQLTLAPRSLVSSHDARCQWHRILINYANKLWYPGKCNALSGHTNARRAAREWKIEWTCICIRLQCCHGLWSDGRQVRSRESRLPGPERVAHRGCYPVDIQAFKADRATLLAGRETRAVSACASTRQTYTHQFNLTAFAAVDLSHCHVEGQVRVEGTGGSIVPGSKLNSSNSAYRCIVARAAPPQYSIRQLANTRTVMTIATNLNYLHTYPILYPSMSMLNEHLPEHLSSEKYLPK
jgi:hypothetical protein